MYLTATQNNSTVLIIWAVCIGVVLGYIGNFVSKAIMGPFVRALLSKGAIGEKKQFPCVRLASYIISSL